MKLRTFAVLLSFVCIPVAMKAAAIDPAVPAEPEQFQVTQRTEVPNTTLAPGSYSIRILDHLRDRVILQVSGKTNHVESTFLAIPASTMANAPVGPIRYSTGPKGKAALKGFAFPGGVAVEFVYPKNDAVSIAQANDTRVMAIDPASEGRVPAPKLNQNDMQMITLWMLEPSRVGASDAKPAGITAAKYQAPETSVQQPVQTAQTEPAPSSPSSSSSYAPSPTAGSTAAVSHPARHPRPAQLAQNDTPPPPPARTHTRPANVLALPHTASNLPLLWLGALVAFLLGGCLSVRRLVSNA